MKELFKQLMTSIETGQDAVMVTVIASLGSTPRGAGSRMLVKADGSVLGTIGGGAVEYRATQIALEAMADQRSLIRGFALTPNEVADIGMICGGNVTVCFQYISPTDPVTAMICQEAADSCDRNQDSWLILDITDVTCWKMGVCRVDGHCRGMELPVSLIRQLNRSKACQITVNERVYYTEPLVQEGIVYIFGGGHVARELVPVLAHVGFRCVVMDDRAEYADPKRFPDAYKTVTGDMERISEFLTVTEKDYVCIMTRGHQYDYLIQKQMLKAGPRYIGIMGSRRKIASVTEKLLEDGFSPDEINRCHMPIGTEIGAETPAEIAISIAGELILERTRQTEK